MASSRWVVFVVVLVTMICAPTRAGAPPWLAGEATRTRVTVVGLDGTGRTVVLDAPRRYAAPDWAPDGKSLIVNGGGGLWRVALAGGAAQPIATQGVGWVDVNHGLAPDGKAMVFTAGGRLFRTKPGGAPAKLAAAAPSYFHSWSPDGKTIAYSAVRSGTGGLDVYTIAADGGAERQLTADSHADDAPQFSADGRWVYFVSDRAGDRDIWRVPASGAGPNDAKAERLTRDDREDVAPRPSPDGKWLYYLSHPPRTAGNAVDRDASIRRIPLDAKGPTGPPREVVRTVGGHGTFGARIFSPDGKRLVFSEFEPPPPTVRIVLFTPSDLSPPLIAAHRLTQIADSTERFLLEGMTRWKYPPAVKQIFPRAKDGSVEVTYVRGDRPASDPSYKKPTVRDEAIGKAKRQLKIDGEGHLWWVFVYLGDRPTRFADWFGGGCSRDGGSSVVNFDTIAGEIRPDVNPASGFNAEYFLKGTIHELGHAFGLPHIGPDPALGLGNSLMGPNNDVYAARKQPKRDLAYLTEASAAMLWKHPVFSGVATGRQRQPDVKLVDYQPSFSRATDRITLAGRVVSDVPVHTVVALDDLGLPREEYWRRGRVARVGADGAFKIVVNHPVKTRDKGRFAVLFCFENGMVSGNGIDVEFGRDGAIVKTYRFEDGSCQFGD
jgi:hypothetical protein